MYLLLVIAYKSIEELQEQLNNNVINDWGSHLLDRVDQCEPGLLWDDQGVVIATSEDPIEVKLSSSTKTAEPLETPVTSAANAAAIEAD